MVRECVYKNSLLKPMNIKLLDASRNYWISKGISDWGIFQMKNKIVRLKDSVVRASDIVVIDNKNALKELQKLVGGLIEIYPKEDDKYLYIVDEEGICKSKE